MKKDQFKKLIKESVKETLDEQKTILKEQDEFCDEMLYLTVNTTMAQNFTGYFPYTVDDFYSWLTDGTPPPGNTYQLEIASININDYTLPDTYGGLEIPDIVSGGTVDSLSQVLEIVMPDAMGAFTQNEDGSLEGELNNLNNFPNIGYLFPIYGGSACWTISVGTYPEGCLTYEQLISFMYTCGEGTGCTDSTATNYDPEATIDDGSCEYAPIEGCTVPGATNYNSQAEIDDGSCEFEFIACYDEVMDLAMSNQENLIGAGTPYEFTSGCGPVTGGYLWGSTYYMPESGMACGGNMTCYDSIDECQTACGGEEITYYGCYSEISSIPTYGSILTSFLGDVSSGCGPIVSAEIAGTTYTPAEACDDSDNESDLDFENYCYDSLIACEHACPIDDPCEGINLNVFAQSIGYSDASKFCHDCLFLDGFSEQYPECECCPERRWRCSSNGICVGGMGTVDQFPYETEDECIMAGCGGWDCEDYEGLNGAQQSLICCYCNPEDCTTTVNLPPQFDVFCELNCCPKKEKECKKCCCRPKPQGAYFEDPECLPLTTVYLAPNHPTCECPDDMIECPKKPKKVIRPSSPDKVATPLRERLMKLANIKNKK